MKSKLTLLLTLCLLSIGTVFGQTITVKGIVLDERNEAVIGATIRLKDNPTVGTTTGIDGDFSIKAKKGELLVVSYVGYKMQELSADKQLTIRLVPDTEVLDEVVVVAYGTTTKKAFTGSATSVSSEKMEMRPISNASQALAGASSGVQTTVASGAPGAGVSIRIRGFGSMNASSSPLIIVDGSPYNGSISDINPSDIDSFTVLKDAASTSIYGSSAGNGVIMITTKAGKAKLGDKRPTIQFTTTIGTSKRGVPEYDLVKAQDYYPVMWEQLRNGYMYRTKKPLSREEAGAMASKEVGKLLVYNPYKGVPIDKIVLPDGRLNPDAGPIMWPDDLDWEDAVTRSALRQDYNISYNYKGEYADAYASIGYLKDNGYTIKSDFERISARVNANFSPTKWLKSGVNISLFRTNSNYIGQGNTSYNNPFFFTRKIGPIYPIHLHDPKTGELILDENGNKIFDYDQRRGSKGMTGRHILAELLYNSQEQRRDGTNSRAYITVTPVEGLSFTTNLSYDNTNGLSSEYKNRKLGDAVDKGSLKRSTYKTGTINFNQLINYRLELRDKHHIDALLGHESYQYKYQGFGSTKGIQVLDDIYEFGNFVSPEDISSSISEYRKEGYFTRLNYDYDHRYYLSGSYRRDGSSRFAPGNKWGNFWSVSTAWRGDEEEFIKNIDWIDTFKLRASYGETGVDDVDTYYAYQTLYSLGYNNFESPGILFTRVGSPKLIWETQVNWDVAFEFGFFNRIRGSIEYFNKESKDLIFGTPLPLSSGNTERNENIGKVRNNGIEVELSADIIKTKDLRWTLSLNATHLRNRITKLPEGQKEIKSGTKKYMEGRSIYDFWLRQYHGVDPKDGMPLYVFDDSEENNYDFSNGGREINGKKYTTNYKHALYDYCGTAIPTVYGGFNTTLAYKGFDVSAFFTYQLGGKVYDSVYSDLMSMNTFGASLHVDAMNKSWKKEGEITDVPRLDHLESTTIGATSSRFLITGNAILLKSLIIGYTLPKNWIDPVGITKARVTLSGENLFLASARKGLNPFASYSGTFSNSYSASKALTFGLQLTF